MKNREKLFEFLQKNYGWIVAGITGVTIVTSFILRFMKYMYSTFYFSYYGLSYGLFNGDELNILYNFAFSILTLFCFGALMFCYIQLFNCENIKFRTKLFDSFLIIISNIIMIVSTNSKYSIFQFSLNVFLLIVMEIFMVKIFIRAVNKEKNRKNDKNDFVNTLKIIPFYLFLIVFFSLINYGFEIKMNKEYRIINNDKVIVYTTNDYYLTLDCEIKNNELIIYKGKQTKINNENVLSELINFDEIKLK